MAVSYDDLDDQQLGKQTRIANLAGEQIAEVAQQAEIEAEEAEMANGAEANQQEAMLAQAQAVIDEMDRVSEQGGNPQAVLDQVPEELAEIVVQLLEQEVMGHEQELAEGQGGMPLEQGMPPEMMGQGQMPPEMMGGMQDQASSNQENVSITDKARRIATSI